MLAIQLLWIWALLWCLMAAVLRHVRRHHHRPAALLHKRLVATAVGCFLVPWTVFWGGLALPILPAGWSTAAPEWPLLALLAFSAAAGGLAVAMENFQLRLSARHRPGPAALQREAVALAPTQQPPAVRVQEPGDLLPAPCTFGWREPTIVLPPDYPDWPEADRRIVLLHELAHIHRADWLWERIARCLRWSLWWLPPAAALYRELRKQAEHAADDWVMAHGIGRVDYAECLLRFACQRSRPQGAIALLEPGAVAGRAAAILDGSRVRQAGAVSNLAFYGALVLALAVIAAVRLGPEPAPTSPVPQWQLWQLPPLPSDAVSEPEPAPHVSLSRAPFLPAALPELQMPRPIAATPAPSSRIEVEPRWPADLPRPLVALAPLAPEYPAAALRRGRRGQVTARFDVAASGRAINIQIIASEPAGTFENAVLAALERARFHRDTETALLARGIELQFKFVPHTQD